MEEVIHALVNSPPGELDFSKFGLQIGSPLMVQEQLHEKLTVVSQLKSEADKLKKEMDDTELEIRNQQKECDLLRYQLRRLDSREALYVC